MNRFLKKAWEATEIPQESYLRARNRAWMELQDGARRRTSSLWYVTGTATVVLLVIVTWSVLETQQVERGIAPLATKQPLATVAPEPASLSDHPSPVKAEAEPKPIARKIPLTSRMPKQDKALKPHSDQFESSTQLVLNFRLPTTGVRMIWIMEKKTSMPGGGL